MFEVTIQMMTQLIEIMPIFMFLYFLFDFLGSFFFGNK